ncbi:hypothetical protein GCM10023165_28840 [Variovorax defluvii]|uniref:Uncharacterized protein n=1 Tax=Variovorax defluvii TaxID=913761 RepID=A0ABP8HV25_9BURK
MSAGTNRFVYALDDPLSVFDDDGLAPKKPHGAAPAPYSPLTGGVIKPSPVPGWQPLQVGVPGRARIDGVDSAGAGRGVVGPFCPPERGDTAKGAAAVAETTFKTGHYASRLEATGVNVARAEAAVANDIAAMRGNLAANADVVRRLTVDGVMVEYRARLQDNGTVNVGTVFPVK